MNAPSNAGKRTLLTLLPIVLLSALTPRTGLGQVPTIQDCLGAIPICQQVYTETRAPAGTGNYPNEVNSNFVCTSSESNSIWYTFTVNKSGNFGFLLTPNANTDDYDWALFNITTAGCDEIFTNRSLLVSCNAAGDETGTRVVCNGPTGATGASNYNIQGPGCSFFPPDASQGFSRYNALIPVRAGNTYALMVNNYTGSTNGYKIDFGLSDAGVIDLQGPEVGAIEFPQTCNEQTIRVTFSENIQCNTLQSDNFRLTGPGGANYTLTLGSEVCKSGASYAREFLLQIEQPIIESGTYTLTLSANGSNEMLDNCNNAAAAGNFTFTFVVDSPGLPAVNLGEDRLSCDGQPVTLDATIPGGSYQWQDRSRNGTYTVTQSGLYRVTVTNVCGQATDEVNVVLLPGPPAVNLGADTVICANTTLGLDVTSERSTYLWQDGSTAPVYPVTAPGTYRVTVTNDCGSTSDAITVEFTNSAPQPDLGEDIVGCVDRDYLLDATSERATYQWQDGSAGPTFTAMQSGLYSVTVTNACGQAVEEIQISTLDGPPVVNLGADTVVCARNGLTLDATNELATYRWQDGASAATYTVAAPGTYAVTVTNVCGSTSDAILVAFVSDVPQFSLGEDIVGCAGQSYLLDASSERATYLWQDGSTAPTFNAVQAGTYSVTAANVCGQTTDAIAITLLDGPPAVELGADSVLCALDNFRLDVSSPGATYRWQDGSTAAVLPVTAGGTYRVTVTNACGPTTDAVTYEVVSGPPRPNLGADETACIGENFTLDATSERATYQWQDGSTAATFRVNQSGTYRVTAANVCGQGTDEVQFTFLNGPPTVELGPDQIKCEGESLQLVAGADPVEYRWSTGATTPAITLSTSNTYRVSVTNACGQVTDAIQVNFIPKIEVDLGDEQYLCDEDVVLDATTHAFASHRWQDGSTAPVYPVFEPGLYVVEITSACETVVDSVRLKRCESCDVYMPNAFSPNNDGQNDLFQPFTSCELTDFTFRIFDRWGALVFESSDPTIGWDGAYNGQELPTGVYVWMIQYTGVENGETFSTTDYGDVLVVR